MNADKKPAGPLFRPAAAEICFFFALGINHLRKTKTKSLTPRGNQSKVSPSNAAQRAPQKNERTKMKTLGQRLMDEARKSNVRLTGEYWGSQLSYEGPGEYHVLHFRAKFGGMAVYKTKRIAVAELRNCDDHESLADLLEPENDFSTGDPMHYTPSQIRRADLVWSPQTAAR